MNDNNPAQVGGFAEVVEHCASMFDFEQAADDELRQCLAMYFARLEIVQDDSLEHEILNVLEEIESWCELNHQIYFMVSVASESRWSRKVMLLWKKLKTRVKLFCVGKSLYERLKGLSAQRRLEVFAVSHQSILFDDEGLLDALLRDLLRQKQKLPMALELDANSDGAKRIILRLLQVGGETAANDIFVMNGAA